MSIFPFFADKPKEMSQRYIELCFKNIDDNNGLRNEFLSSWQNIVSNHFSDLDPIEWQSVFEDEILKSKAQSTWKYAASQGVNDTPQLYFKGKKMENTPKNHKEWEKLLNTIIIL